MISTDLFSGQLIELPNSSKKTKDYLRDPLFEEMRFGITLTGKHQMPIVKSGPEFIPVNIEGFSRALPKRIAETVPHFYIDDGQISRLMTDMKGYMERLRYHAAVIAPDFSVYMDMPSPHRTFNCYLNKLIAAYWQKNGLNVFPNVSWSDANSLEGSAEGWPKHSIIAINSTGIGRNKKSKRLWIEGYEYMLEQLQPTHILRYGAKQEGEIEDISTYYLNDNFNSVHYGR